MDLAGFFLSLALLIFYIFLFSLYLLESDSEKHLVSEFFLDEEFVGRGKEKNGKWEAKFNVSATTHYNSLRI